MAWFKKKPDPISDRARSLSAEIAALEQQIRTLDAKVQKGQSAPRLRSTAMPRGESAARPPLSGPSPAAHEPIFEEIDQNRLKSRGEAESTNEHYNELGVRKYDLPALLRRFKNHFRGPSTNNPKLVSYLAAGGIQGLRPMRTKNGLRGTGSSC